MDDGIVFPPRATSPGHDITPAEEYPGYLAVHAILGSENYSGGGRRYTNVYVSQSRGAPIQEPIDEGAEAKPSSDPSHDGAKYFSERERLRTFEKWRESYHVTPIDLARDGFIHIGPEDRVLCVFCLKTIVDWEANDNVQKEHARLYPNCPFVRGKCQDLNKPFSRAENLKQDMHVHKKGIDAKYPAFAKEAIRLETFVNWPLLDNTPRPADLAAAGLFYQPMHGKKDRVRCFMCGKALHKWQNNDDPWVEHAKINQNCKFVLERKGEDFVRQCHFKAAPETGPAPMNHQGPEESEEIQHVTGGTASNTGDFLNHTAAQAVLQEFGNNFSVDQVRKALEELTLANGPEKPVTSEELLSKIWEGEGSTDLNISDMDDEEMDQRGGTDLDMIIAEDDILLDL